MSGAHNAQIDFQQGGQPLPGLASPLSVPGLVAWVIGVAGDRGHFRLKLGRCRVMGTLRPKNATPFVALRFCNYHRHLPRSKCHQQL